MGRYAEVTRKTGETDIVVKLDLDGSGVCDISTGVPFFDHMLNAFGRHGLFDLTVNAVGEGAIEGAITGRALYEDNFTLAQALAAARGEE